MAIAVSPRPAGSWTGDREAVRLLASCAAHPPEHRRHVASYAMTRDEWTGFEGDRAARLETIREEWIANAVGFSWEGPRPGNPIWGTPQWEAMRAAWFALSDLQPSVEQTIFDALSNRKDAA